MGECKPDWEWLLGAPGARPCLTHAWRLRLRPRLRPGLVLWLWLRLRPRLGLRLGRRLWLRLWPRLRPGLWPWLWLRLRLLRSQQVESLGGFLLEQKVAPSHWRGHCLSCIGAGSIFTPRKADHFSTGYLTFSPSSLIACDYCLNFIMLHLQ